jgi:hypothetical protein
VSEIPTERAAVPSIPVAAIPAVPTIPAAVISYREPGATLGPAEQSRVEGFNWLLLSTFLSPATIAVSFWYLYEPRVGVLATVAFLLTLVASVVSSVKLGGGGVAVAPAGRVLDGVAGVALIFMAAIPLLYRSHDAMDRETHFMPVASFAFALMAIATPRFLYYYGAMAAVARSAGRVGLARFATTVGVLKLIDEFAMLGSVALFTSLIHSKESGDLGIFFGFLALGAVAGYGVVWVPTLVLHLRLRSVALHPGRATRSGFDVMMKPISVSPLKAVPVK